MSETRRIRLRISAQAGLLIRQSKDFDLDEFVDYLMKQGFPVGSSNVVEYLIIKDSRNRERDPAGETVEVDVKVGVNGAIC